MKIYKINFLKMQKEQYMNAFAYVFIGLEKNPKYDQSSITNENEKDWLEFMKIQDLHTKYHNAYINNAVKYVQDIINNRYEGYIRYQISDV